MNGIRRRRGQPPGESRRSRIPVSLRGQPLTGELQLRLAVLEDCLRDVLGTGGRRPSRLRRQREVAWITSRDRRAPFAYESLCEALGIDAERLRRRVLAALGPPDRLW